MRPLRVVAVVMLAVPTASVDVLPSVCYASMMHPFTAAADESTVPLREDQTYEVHGRLALLNNLPLGSNVQYLPQFILLPALAHCTHGATVELSSPFVGSTEPHTAALSVRMATIDDTVEQVPQIQDLCTAPTYSAATLAAELRTLHRSVGEAFASTYAVASDAYTTATDVIDGNITLWRNPLRQAAHLSKRTTAGYLIALLASDSCPADASQRKRGNVCTDAVTGMQYQTADTGTFPATETKNMLFRIGLDHESYTGDVNVGTHNKRVVPYRIRASCVHKDDDAAGPPTHSFLSTLIPSTTTVANAWLRRRVRVSAAREHALQDDVLDAAALGKAAKTQPTLSAAAMPVLEYLRSDEVRKTLPHGTYTDAVEHQSVFVWIATAATVIAALVLYQSSQRSCSVCGWTQVRERPTVRTLVVAAAIRLTVVVGWAVAYFVLAVRVLDRVDKVCATSWQPADNSLATGTADSTCSFWKSLREVGVAVMVLSSFTLAHQAYIALRQDVAVISNASKDNSQFKQELDDDIERRNPHRDQRRSIARFLQRERELTNNPRAYLLADSVPPSKSGQAAWLVAVRDDLKSHGFRTEIAQLGGSCIHCCAGCTTWLLLGLGATTLLARAWFVTAGFAALRHQSHDMSTAAADVPLDARSKQSAVARVWRTFLRWRWRLTAVAMAAITGTASAVTYHYLHPHATHCNFGFVPFIKDCAVRQGVVVAVLVLGAQLLWRALLQKARSLPAAAKNKTLLCTLVRVITAMLRISAAAVHCYVVWTTTGVDPLVPIGAVIARLLPSSRMLAQWHLDDAAQHCGVTRNTEALAQRALRTAAPLRLSRGKTSVMTLPNKM